MKILVALLLSSSVCGAVPVDRSLPYVTPIDTMSTLQGRVRVCNPARLEGGANRLSFQQTGERDCPPEPSAAKGWSRPFFEPNSPGIPFNNQGLE